MQLNEHVFVKEGEDVDVLSKREKYCKLNPLL